MKQKAELALTDLLSRQDYLVVQGNDLAKSFVDLKLFEQRLLDYCFSFFTRDPKLDDEYEVSDLEIIKYFGLNTSGENYRRIAESFKRINESAVIYFSLARAYG